MSAVGRPRNNPIAGAGYLLKGVQLALQPGLRRFVVVPVLINSVLFASVIYFGAGWIYDFSRDLLPDFSNWPGWLAWLAVVLDWMVGLLVPLFLLLAAVAVFFSFGLVANLLASPFNGMLAEAVESRLTGHVAPSAGLGKIMKDVGLAIGSEVRKLGYILVRIVPLLLLFLVPVAGPLLWAIFSAWMLAISFVDYPMGNHGLSFPEQRRLLGERRWLALGFGLAVMAAMAIPVVNFVVMPCAVAGATALWVDAFAPGARGDSAARPGDGSA